MGGGRVWKTSEDGEISWVTITPDLVPGALEVMRAAFLPHECVSIGLMLAGNEDASKGVDRMCELIAEDETSIAAVEVATGRVVGVALNKIQTNLKPGDLTFIDILRRECGSDPAFTNLLDFFVAMDSQVNIFERYEVPSLLEHMFLAVLKEFRNKGLAKGLVLCTEMLATGLARGEVIVKNPNALNVGALLAIFTSRISQCVGRALQWDELATVGHDQFNFAGKKFSDRIGPEHPENVLMAKRVMK